MCTVYLDRLVDNLKCHPRRIDFGHCNVSLSSFESVIICLHCCQVTQQPRFGDLHPGFCDALSKSRLVGKQFAEGGPTLRPVDDGVQRLLCCADRAHAMVDSTRPKSALGNFETASLPEQHVGHWHPHILKDDFSVVMDVAKYSKRPDNRDSRGIARDK
eukprot:CAMPEP_0172663216 /NCGR_PEP_ID=MMETSP1074-20121228/5777_1 /TAXON_ID=2916 /ORGANISM="Ceratium fusus, Strain PA161109" /LENGTH=158 /DNA_ID=CAMNT_0013479171 /DNA_START=329 /DNA_END=805 /DNA_ORIENTATION=+